MFTITLDIFSGFENPTWMLSFEEGQQLLDRIAQGGVRMAPYDPSDPKFGVYQGMLIEKAYVPVSGFLDKKLADTYKNLPNQFRMIGDRSLKSEEEAWLFQTAHKMFVNNSNLLNAVWSTVRLSKQLNQNQTPAKNENVAKATPKTQCILSYSHNDFDFWNGWWSRTTNNCYNYACGIKTNTFAQPGRASGDSVQAPVGCHDQSFPVRFGVIRRALADGVKEQCNQNSFYVGLAVRSDGNDYHWWREIAPGQWGHKPEKKTARDYDWSNNSIANPETSDRGPYDVWCGYYYVPLWINIQ